jgi:hypothetical protein
MKDERMGGDFYLFTFYFYLSSSYPDSHTASSEMEPDTEMRSRTTTPSSGESVGWAQERGKGKIKVER